MRSALCIVRFSLLALLLSATPPFLKLAVALPTSSPQAETTTEAILRGTIRDTSDAAVSGAAIVLTLLSPTTPATQPIHAASGNDGRFELSVPAGRYRLAISRTSFNAFDQELTLSAGETLNLDVRLTIATLSASVVVSAGPLPQPAVAASEPVDIVVRDETDQRQTIELAPLLETLPGITLGQGGPPGGPVSVFMDGGNSNYTKLLVDGIPMNDPGGAMDFSNLTLDNIDKVEVVHGAQSALAGSDAMTGTVEIFTHQGSTQTPLLVLEGEGGSFGTGRGTAQFSGLIHNFDYSVDAAYFQTAGEGPNDRFLNRTLSGNFGYKFSPTNVLRVTLHGSSSDAGIPGQTLFEPASLYQHNTLSNLAGGVTWDFATGSHWQHHILVTETDIHEIYQNPLASFFTADPAVTCPYPLAPNAVESNFCNYTYYDANQFNRVDATAQSSYVTSHFSFTLGYWYEVENGFPGDLGFHVRRNNMAGFVDGRWQVTSRLVLNAGFREDDNANFGTHADPRAGASYLLRYGHDFWGATRLRFSYGQGIKEPEFDENYGTNPCAPGNPNLAPEQSTTINSGIEQALAHNRISISGDFFYNRFHDIISFGELPPTPECPASIGGPGNYFNTDLARAEGSHLRFQSQITRRITFGGNYTYDDTRVLVAPNAFDPSETPGNHLLWRPVNSGNLVLNGTFNRFQANLLGVFIGRRTGSDFLGLGYTSVAGYVRVDMALSYRLSSRVTLLGRAINLLDNKYQNELGYPSLGIGAYGGVQLALGGNPPEK